MSGTRARFKPGRASLIGGAAVGIASFVLWMAVTHEAGVGGAAWIVAGVLVSGAIASWIRIADL